MGLKEAALWFTVCGVILNVGLNQAEGTTWLYFGTRYPDNGFDNGYNGYDNGFNGYDNGYNGYDNGYNGYDNGYDNGYNNGYDNGYNNNGYDNGGYKKYYYY